LDLLWLTLWKSFIKVSIFLQLFQNLGLSTLELLYGVFWKVAVATLLLAIVIGCLASRIWTLPSLGTYSITMSSRFSFIVLTIFHRETSNSTTFLWWLWLTVRLLLDTTISPPDHLAVCTGCGCTTWYCHATIWHLEWCSIVLSCGRLLHLQLQTLLH